MQNVTQYYEEDHDRLDGLFQAYQRQKRTDFPKAKEAFAEFKMGLQRHIVWEEDILFPLFEQKTGMRDMGPTVVMRREHLQIGAALEVIHQKVREGDPNADEDEKILLEILSAHNDKEENMLYPAIDRLITQEETGQVFEKMKQVPKERYATCCGGH